MHKLLHITALRIIFKMCQHLLICNIFFIFVGGKIIPPVTTATKSTLPEMPLPFEKGQNTTQTVTVEGGSSISSNSATLPNGDYIALMNLEKELSGNKEKSVVPRKGVNGQDGIKNNENLLTITNTSTVQLDNKPDYGSQQSDTQISNGINVTNDVQKTNDTEVHKPLIVSSEALAKMDKMNNLDLKETSQIVQVHTVKAGSHPELIVPIVITILVVPMFAVVAYLALKKGKEAWKNRHYKRMDFLLDGMYND